MKPILLAMAIGVLIVLIIIGIFLLFLLSQRLRHSFAGFIEYLMFWR